MASFSHTFKLEHTSNGSCFWISYIGDMRLASMYENNVANGCKPHRLRQFNDSAELKLLTNSSQTHTIKLVYCEQCLIQLVVGHEVCGKLCSVISHQREYLCQLPPGHTSVCKCGKCENRDAFTQIGTFLVQAGKQSNQNVQWNARGAVEVLIFGRQRCVSLAENTTSIYSSKKHSSMTSTTRTGFLEHIQDLTIFSPMTARQSLVQDSTFEEFANSIGMIAPPFATHLPLLLQNGQQPRLLESFADHTNYQQQATTEWGRPCVETQHKGVVMTDACWLVARLNGDAAAVKVPIVICEVCGKATCVLLGPSQVFRGLLPAAVTSSLAWQRLTEDFLHGRLILNANVPCIRLVAPSPTAALIKRVQEGVLVNKCVHCCLNRTHPVAVHVRNKTAANSYFHFEHHEQHRKRRHFGLVSVTKTSTQHHVQQNKELFVTTADFVLVIHRLQCSVCDHLESHSDLEKLLLTLVSANLDVGDNAILNQLKQEYAKRELAETELLSFLCLTI